MFNPKTNKVATIFFMFLIVAISGFAQKHNEERLLQILGDFPPPPSVEVDTIESVKLETGWRYKIEYVAEGADTLFNRPVDKIKAYLFVPEHKKGEKLPAIVAIHQDGRNTHLGKSEPAGLSGDTDQYYGLELFQRGYVVICPDRYGHAERRRIPNPETAGSEMMRDLGLWLKWAGQLKLSGRTNMGKEVYDLMRAVDVLYTYDFVNKDKVGAIGHSAGGNVLVYFMFVDRRVKVGASSCGFYELLDDFNDRNRSFSNSVFALPGLAKIGRSADYLAYVAPRPFIMTRGLREMQNEEDSKKHVASTQAIESYAKQRYNRLKVNDNMKSIYFDGGHAFPQEVREQAYKWLDSYLKI